MDISTMSVNVTDKSISINGEGHVCAAEYFPAVDSNIVALHWHPEKQGRCKGSVSRHVGGGEGIDDFTLFQPFVKAWEDAKERKQARSAMIAAEAQGAFDEPAAVEETPSDLPRFLRSQEPTVSAEMQAKLSDFEQRVQETVSKAHESIAASKDESTRIHDLESRLSALERALREAMASKGGGE